MIEIYIAANDLYIMNISLPLNFLFRHSKANVCWSVRDLLKYSISHKSSQIVQWGSEGRDCCDVKTKWNFT